MRRREIHTLCGLLAGLALVASVLQGAETRTPQSPTGDSTESPGTPVLPIGLDAYRQWERWPYQRIGARAYMRSTYDRRGGNEGADASHFLYQLSDDFNVTLDVAGPGVLYFARYNHWHGSPWHYEVDGVNHVVRETGTADPVNAKKTLKETVFIPEALFPQPLTWTWSTTKGADLMWVPLAFERTFRMAYTRTRYGTGYYIYHLYDRSAPLSQPIRSWDGKTPPERDVLELLDRAGADIAPRADSEAGKRLGVQQLAGRLNLAAGQTAALTTVDTGPAMLRAIEITAPVDQALALGRARLRVSWDGREEPSIDAPVALFFGAGTLYNRDGREYLVKGLPMHIRFADQRVHLACFFPMPFFRSAKVELVGGAAAVEDVQWRLRHHAAAYSPAEVGYFHATYRDHPSPEFGHDLVVLDTREAEGGGAWSGSFVGMSWIFSHRGVLTTLEGDPRFFFDDSQTPQAYGTGTEEWGGGGDYWGGENMTLPLAGHPCGARSPKEAQCDEDLIQSAYRFLLADLMPFGHCALIRLEHGGENRSTEHYETVAYWYGAPAAALVQTDALKVGDVANERAHRYVSPQASPPYEIESRYEWGPDTLVDESSSTAERPLAEPADFAEFEFEAAADVRYTIWVRGKNLDGKITSDACWLQFDEAIGTDKLGDSYNHPKGFGNWLDRFPARTYAWSSALPQDPPQSVTFRRGGRHRLRVQPRHAKHIVDQIWLSSTQQELPRAPDRVNGRPGEIVLSADQAQRLAGKVRVIPDEDAPANPVLEIDGGSQSKTVIIYPPHRDVGRKTAGVSEFSLKLRPDNFGVVLRRTLDYAFPNQRAEVWVAPVQGDAVGEFQMAGIWYLAGSNTCIYSNPREELGATQHNVQVSNRRFRDDEFIVPRELTRGLAEMRVQIRFTPVEIPLFPGHPLPELAWSELAYTAYCWVLPEWSP